MQLNMKAKAPSPAQRFSINIVTVGLRILLQLLNVLYPQRLLEKTLHVKFNNAANNGKIFHRLFCDTLTQEINQGIRHSSLPWLC